MFKGYGIFFWFWTEDNKSSFFPNQTVGVESNAASLNLAYS